MARLTLMEVTANVAMMSKAEIITELTKINGDHSGIKNVLVTRWAKVVFDNQPPEQVYPSPPRLPGPLTAKLTELKECLHSKLITQEQYNTAVLAVVTPGSTAVTPTESAEASVVGVTSLEDANSKALRELRTLDGWTVGSFPRRRLMGCFPGHHGRVAAPAASASCGIYGVRPSHHGHVRVGWSWSGAGGFNWAG